ncbi:MULTISPECIES: NAD(P)/FAD-dependent oxidoreductase [unclassified Microcoleus]|uniref:NAD(P)/FAD-dependent oxidoreductase n=1 Tax=unclassified Microcoleus TaxID=2642155 RepID=UPI002FCEDC91
MEIKQVSRPVVHKVAVIGGGLGGLATAIALRKQGIDAHVYERAQEFRPVGAGLALFPNGLHSLDAISPGIVENLKRASCTLNHSVFTKHTGEIITQNTATHQEKYGQPTLLFWWWRLQQVLACALPPEAIHLDYRCIGFEQDENGVTAYFDGDKSVRADLLIGADGINSPVRKTLIGDGEPRYLGSMSWRAVIEYNHELLNPNELILMRGEQKALFLFDVGGGYKSWTVRALMPKCPVPESAPEIKSSILEKFSTWWEPARGIMEATDPKQILFFPLCDRLPLKSWSQGRVTLLGDAAHPMSPSLGQGANSTFEDAYELAQCLSQSSSIAEALTTYENRRIPRTQLLQARSALTEQRFYATDIGTQDPEKAARERVAFEEFQSWAYGYDPNSESRLKPWMEISAT